MSSSLLFPVILSPSPVQAAFHGTLLWDTCQELGLSVQERLSLRAADAAPLEYTLADPHDTDAYLHTLLQLLEASLPSPNSANNNNINNNNNNSMRYSSSASAAASSSSKVARLGLETSLTDDQSLQLQSEDPVGVVRHFTVSRLTELIICLREVSRHSRVTLASTFYPNGILIELWRPLLRALHQNGADAYGTRGAAFCLANILLEGCHLETKFKLLGASISSILESFVSWLASRLQSSSSTSRGLAVIMPSLTVLMVSREARDLFDQAGGIGYLSRQLRVPPPGSSSANLGEAARPPTGPSMQQYYELTYCLWLLSLDVYQSESRRRNFHRDGAVPALVDLVTSSPREKVLRVAWATLRNLATCAKAQELRPSNFLNDMIGCGLMNSIHLMKERKWTDPDIVEDVQILSDMLQESFREMTRWDVYRSEVESSHLKWGVVHSEKFFQENAKMMEGPDGKFTMVKTLIRLASGSDSEVAAIACYDIGEFVRHYPGGRQLAKRLGAREVVMGLIDHEDEDLKRQALLSLSKMLVQNWASIR